MTLEELYAQYGKATVALEIAQGQFNEIKKILAKELNKSKELDASTDTDNSK